MLVARLISPPARRQGDGSGWTG